MGVHEAVEATAGIALSSLDEERFGIRTARASHVSAQQVAVLAGFCRTNRVKLLIARCSTGDLPAAQAMERAGYILMDTLVYYDRDLTRAPIPDDRGTVPVRPIRPGEEDQVRAVAAEAFKGYLGHYHADERLERKSCDEAYTSWAVRSCMGNAADEVLVADLDGAIVGFATLRLTNPDEGEGVLFGVGPAAQGRGIYRSFMIGGMNWCRSQGAARMVVSTQITNVVVQKVWTRVGFEMSHSYYTFHKWFDN
jgi:GNAT superfamily N-acetyltransferase